VRRASGRREAEDPAAGAARADVERVEALWSQCLRDSGGPWLFGPFGIADAMYAPVALRFTSYGVALGAEAEGYRARVEALPAVRTWTHDALLEPERVPETDRRAERYGL